MERIRWHGSCTYVNKKPNEPMDKLVHEFVKFVNSKEGQEIVVKRRLLPHAGGHSDRNAYGPEVRTSFPLPAPVGEGVQVALPRRS